MNPTHRRSTAVRWAVLAAEIVAGVAAVGLIVLVPLVAYVGHEVGDVFAPVRMSGPVGDRSVRAEYEYSHLVTAAQIASIHPHMSGKTALRILGGRSQKIPDSTWIKHHWVRTGTCYDYPIAGTGHLYDGFTVADEAEICLEHPRDDLSDSHVVVRSITRTRWRKVGDRLSSACPPPSPP